MALVLVTGISGAGKSTVCHALQARGHEAIDADWEGFNHWAHRITGEPVTDPPYPTPVGWLDEYGWRIDIPRVEALSVQSRDTLVFLCTSVENEEAILHHIDAVACLVADDATIAHRLATRSSNDFGKSPDQLAAALAWNKTQESRYRSRGAIIIDATQTQDAVVTQLLAQVSHLSPKT